MRKGVAAKILEIIRYSPFFNFEYNLLTLYNFVSMHFFPKIFIQQLVSLLAFNAKKYSKIVKTLQTVEISFCQKFQLWVTDEIWSFKLNLCTTTTTVHFYQDKLAKFDDTFPCERFLNKIWWNIPTEVVGIFRCTYNGEKTCLEFSNLQNPLLLDCPKWDKALTDIRSWSDVIAASYLPFPPLSVFL